MVHLKRTFFWALIVGLILISIGIILPMVLATKYAKSSVSLTEQALVASEVEGKPIHIKTPNSVKAIYMTSCVAGTPSWRTSLKELIDTTELNAVVIDIKDSTGIISFRDESLQQNNIAGLSGCKVRDMKEFIHELHLANIYVIGRLSVFQDPYYTKIHPELAVKRKSDGEVWKDRKGLSFVDVSAKPYWEFVIKVAEASYDLGFDEINFDYIRYPSDGDMQNTYFSWSNASTTKPEALEGFFKYLHANLKDTGMVTSADLFGMTTTIENDMNIGQVLERALPYFDYIAPMVYPSHYPAGWNGFANPSANPYEVIQIAMARGVAREQALNIANGLATTTPSKLRPWLQDFNLGATYTPEMVRAQIQATYDVGLNSWMMWNAGNKYTGSALLPE